MCWYLNPSGSDLDEVIESKDNSAKTVTLKSGKVLGQSLVADCAVSASNDRELKAFSDLNELIVMVADIIYAFVTLSCDLLTISIGAAPLVGDALAAPIEIVKATADFVYTMASIFHDNLQFTLGELQTHPTDLMKAAQMRADANSMAVEECLRALINKRLIA
jgi:hypothetical protein